MTRENEGQGDEGQGRSTAEWVSFGVAAALLLGVAGLIVYHWLAGPQGPPILAAARSGAIREAGGHFYVPFTVANTGGETAANVRVVAELRLGGEVVERGEQTFAFIAGGERQAGAFVFRRDPQTGELTIHIGGYQQP